MFVAPGEMRGDTGDNAVNAYIMDRGRYHNLDPRPAPKPRHGMTHVAHKQFVFALVLMATLLEPSPPAERRDQHTKE